MPFNFRGCDGATFPASPALAACLLCGEDGIPHLPTCPPAVPLPAHACWCYLCPGGYLCLPYLPGGLQPGGHFTPSLGPSAFPTTACLPAPACHLDVPPALPPLPLPARPSPITTHLPWTGRLHTPTLPCLVDCLSVGRMLVSSRSGGGIHDCGCWTLFHAQPVHCLPSAWPVTVPHWLLFLPWDCPTLLPSLPPSPCPGRPAQCYLMPTTYTP